MEAMDTYSSSSVPIFVWLTQMLKLYIVPFAIKLIGVLLVFWIGTKIVKWTRKIVERALTKGNADKGVITFLDSFVKFGMYAILLVIILGMFGVEMTSIAAVLASAGVAIGLALQGSLSNLAGGVLILLLKPFGVGDYIVTGGYEGTVTEIQLFYTKLTTVDNKVVILPNGTLSNGSMINVSVMDKRRVDMAISVAYDTDLNKAKNIMLDVLKECPYILQEEPHQAFVEDLTTSGVKLHARLWVASGDYFTAYSYLAEQFKNAFEKNQIVLFYNKAIVMNEAGK